MEKVSVPVDCDGSIGLGGYVGAATAAHLLEVVHALIGTADLRGQELRPTGRDDDAASDAGNDLRGLAVGIRKDDDGPPDGEAPWAARSTRAGPTPLVYGARSCVNRTGWTADDDE